MVTTNARTKTRADMLARMKRKMGFNVTVFKKKKGYGISVTRGK